MSSASLTTTPGEAQLVAEHREHPRGSASPAGRRGRRTTTCAVITAGTPAPTAAANGARSRSRQTCLGRRRRRAARGGSRCGSRRAPGSASRRPPRPPPASPRRRRRRAGRPGRASPPNDRTPITGLSGSQFTSRTGASTRSTPGGARPPPEPARRPLGSPSTSSRAPSAACPGHGEPVARVQPGHRAALLVGGHQHADAGRVQAASGARQPARGLRRSARTGRRRPIPSARPLAAASRRRRAEEARQQHASSASAAWSGSSLHRPGDQARR